MDPVYSDKKIVDLTEDELIALGFLGENVAPGVKRMVERVKSNPKHLGPIITCLMLDCFRNKYPMPAPSKDGAQASPSSQITGS